MPSEDQPSDAAERLAALARATHLPPPSVRRRIRQQARVTLREIAEAMGVQEVSVWRWEHGVANPSPTHAREYRRVLDALEEASRAIA